MPFENKSNAPLPPRKPYDYLSTLPILHGVDNEEIKKFTRAHETPVPYMYPDSKGNITVGVGLHLPTVRDAQALPFDYTVGIDKRRAYPNEIERAYNKIKNQKYNGQIYTDYDPDKYSSYDNIKLGKDNMEQYLDDKLRQSARELRQKLPGFDTFEPEAQRALLDMQFNIGDTKFREQYSKNEKPVPGWPKLFEAIAKRDWLTAAEESHRKDVQDSRNEDTRRLFIDASERGRRGH